MSEVTMPKTEDKTPCEVCGDMVTTHKGGRASHMRKHESSEQKAPEAVKVVAKSDTKPTEEDLIIARALEAEERFRKAPEIFLSEDTSDGNASLVRMYAPDCLDKFDHIGNLVKRAERHAFFSSRENLIRWASKGYIPVKAENGSYVTNDGGDILTTCDRRVSDSREARSQQESRNIVRSTEKNLGAMNVEGAEGSSNSDLRNTTLEVSQEEIEI
jgi:hypothetical protein